jgi:hypothetical protein
LTYPRGSTGCDALRLPSSLSLLSVRKEWQNIHHDIHYRKASKYFHLFLFISYTRIVTLVYQHGNLQHPVFPLKKEIPFSICFVFGRDILDTLERNKKGRTVTHDSGRICTCCFLSNITLFEKRKKCWIVKWCAKRYN